MASAQTQKLPRKQRAATVANADVKSDAETSAQASAQASAKASAKAKAGTEAGAQANAKETPFGASMPDAQAWFKALQSMMPGAAGIDATSNGTVQLPEMPAVRVDPACLHALQADYQQRVAALWRGYLSGEPQARTKDRRFSGDEWQGMHAYVAGLYEINSHFMSGLAENVEADAKTKAKIKFAVQQWIDAMSPANYFATNPEAQKKLFETQGESLQAGLANMLGDLQKGRISQTDESAFEVGKNVANSAGAVVYQNDLFQLIQYRPLTRDVYERPLLMVPPCINKFYILDLQPDNSLVRNAVASGHTVFLVSWCNPGKNEAHYTWDDYIGDGIVQAIEVTQQISKQERINMLGFCVGGTMLATALAVLAARGEQPAASLTLLTTLLDFTDTGILDVFVDEAQVRRREQSIGGLTRDGKPGGPIGLMPARDLAASFSFLRPNDLIWNYVVSNYLKGEAPPPFDLLYWNADSTSMPGPFYVWYLRNTYLENNLKIPGKTKVCGEPVDFGIIEAPVFLYGSREDHIVPWQSAYASIPLFNGPKIFVLGASGHIAGVINPPAKKKRSYWTCQPLRGAYPADSETWFNSATEHPGSWWPEWTGWLGGHGGKMVKAPAEPGNRQYRALEEAPGSYVKVRAA